MSCISRCWVRRALAFVLALALGFAPTMPAFASAQMDQTVSESHAAHGVADVNAATTHADHAKVAQEEGATGHKNVSCDKQDRCSGQCCAACAQCFTAAFNFSITSIQTYSVQFPTVLRLDDRLTVAAHNRPPTV